LFTLLTSWYRLAELPEDVVAATPNVKRAPTAKPTTAPLMSIFVFINRDMRDHEQFNKRARMLVASKPG
jgi:hypothetical protein